MKVLILRADSGGCALYRCLEPARVVQEQFPEIDIRVESGADVDGDRDRRTRMITVIREVKEDVDLIVVQRPLDHALDPMLAQARKQGIATIIELDDDFSSIHPSNTAFTHVQPENDLRANKMWLAKMAAEADLFTCTTEELTKYNPDRHAILPNYVPESIFDVKRAERDHQVVGWTGTLQTHPADLQVTNGQVGKVLADSGAPFFVVGDKLGVAQALRLRPGTSINDTGWLPLEEYYQAIADNIDIGIVPLEHSTFNRAKSALKFLEMSALGIPAVATSTHANQILHEAGVGKLADDHNGFRYALRNWLNNPEQARRDGEEYRAIVREEFTYEQHAEDWLRAWERAIDTRKKAIN